MHKKNLLFVFFFLFLLPIGFAGYGEFEKKSVLIDSEKELFSCGQTEMTIPLEMLGLSQYEGEFDDVLVDVNLVKSKRSKKEKTVLSMTTVPTEEGNVEFSYAFFHEGDYKLLVDLTEEESGARIAEKTFFIEVESQKNKKAVPFIIGGLIIFLGIMSVIIMTFMFKQ